MNAARLYHYSPRNTRKLDSLERLWVAFTQQTNQFTKSAAEPTRQRQSIELDSIKTLSIYGLGTIRLPPLLLTGNGQRAVISHFLFDMAGPQSRTYIIAGCAIYVWTYLHCFITPYWFGVAAPDFLPQQHNIHFFSLFFFSRKFPPSIKQTLHYTEGCLTCIACFVCLCTYETINPLTKQVLTFQPFTTQCYADEDW